jgi:dTDP-4-dehydrorhamnose 3,5-epimerase
MADFFTTTGAASARPELYCAPECSLMFRIPRRSGCRENNGLRMRITPTHLMGAYLVEIDPNIDDRGFFARTWCQTRFADKGLHASWVQSSVSYNPRKGTLRGLHYQAEPFPEIKLVRCTRGTAFDVIVDLRPDSPTRNKWFGIELSSENHRAIYVPAGFAHGFQTLCAETELLYQVSEFYRPDLARGVRWNDEVLAIAWPPCEDRLISQRDLALPRIACRAEATRN